MMDPLGIPARLGIMSHASHAKSRRKVKKRKHISISDTEKFYRNKKRIPGIILHQIKSKDIIYGAHAINKQVPKYLQRETKDFDVYTDEPRKRAKQTERALDREFNADLFYTVPAKHYGTSKVRSYIDQEGYADFTKKKDVKTVKIGGKQYAHLDAIEKRAKQLLKNKEAPYRKEKDIDTLNRIALVRRRKKV